MRKFLVNFISNDNGATHSTKKIFFVICSCCAYIVPMVLLFYGHVDKVLDFWKFIIPATIGSYVYGKKIESEKSS